MLSEDEIYTALKLIFITMNRKAEEQWTRQNYSNMYFESFNVQRQFYANCFYQRDILYADPNSICGCRDLEFDWYSSFLLTGTRLTKATRRYVLLPIKRCLQSKIEYTLMQGQTYYEGYQWELLSSVAGDLKDLVRLLSAYDPDLAAKCAIQYCTDLIPDDTNNWNFLPDIYAYGQPYIQHESFVWWESHYYIS
jgi:hypothetical protein